MEIKFRVWLSFYMKNSFSGMPESAFFVCTQLFETSRILGKQGRWDQAHIFFYLSLKKMFKCNDFLPVAYKRSFIDVKP